ncbi:MAG: Transcriptional Regulator, GntR family [Conexibacter sp.]|jgi:DNA-binding GntR family transcriptional regulator|nr:Transcriptional Regulator, GntR family [Conexibacter sp.]MCZ4493210.1 Transcriptional Regulator, GntR family [Conexibacter sp.]
MAAKDRRVTPPKSPTLGVGRTVLRDQVKTLLLDRILSGVYAPGDRLIETRIAQELGTSQAPVREALRELELLRFVESASFRGTWVREVSDDELIEVFPIRAALEEIAAREAAKRLNGDVAALEAEIEGMANARDVREQVEHDVRFHRLIVEASGNSRLMEVWDSLQVDARTTITALGTGLPPEKAAELHRPILEALRRKSAKAAGREIRGHVEMFGKLLIEQRGHRS